MSFESLENTNKMPTFEEVTKLVESHEVDGIKCFRKSTDEEIGLRFSLAKPADGEFVPTHQNAVDIQQSLFEFMNSKFDKELVGFHIRVMNQPSIEISVEIADMSIVDSDPE